MLECHGISLTRVKGMRFRARAMRFMRAKGEGVAEIRVRGSWLGGDMLCWRSLISSSIEEDCRIIFFGYVSPMWMWVCN